MARKTDSKSAPRTTRYAVANLVKGSNLVFHVEGIVVKAPSTVKEFIKTYLGLHHTWGNIDKVPADAKISKEPYEIELHDDYRLIVAVIAVKDAQCPVCGIWKEDGKSDYCPHCNGKVVQDETMTIDI